MTSIWNQIAKIFDKQTILITDFGKYLLTSITDHIPFTSHEAIDVCTKWLIKLTWKDDINNCDKIVWEEDRGGYLTALVSFVTKKSFWLVKWNPTWLWWDIKIDFRNAYTSWTMYLNGVVKWDKVIIFEDLIDSGGTIIWLIKLLQKASVEILDVVCLAAKEDNKWLEKIKKETWFDVKHAVKFTLDAWKKSKVTWINPILGE